MDLLSACVNGNVDYITGLTSDELNVRFDLGEDEYGTHYLGLTPLMVAAGSPWSNLETVSALIGKGAETEARSSSGSTAVSFAVEGFPAELVQSGHEGESPKRDVSDRVKFLLGRGSSVDECDPFGQSLLYRAAVRGDRDLMALLLDEGASYLPRCDSAEETSLAEKTYESPVYPCQSRLLPLNAASSSGSIECVDLLLDRGINVDSRGIDGFNALAYAVEPEMASHLIKAGASMDSLGSWNTELLEDKLRDGLYDVARVLLDHGYQDFADGWMDVSTSGFAGFYMDPIALKLLVEYGGELTTPASAGGGTILHTACWQHDHFPYNDGEQTIGTLEYLVEQGIPLEGRDDLGRTALHLAVSGDMPAPIATRTLLRLGANVNAQDDHGSTALMLSAELVSLEGIQILLEAGADLGLRDSVGMTALDYLLDALHIREMVGHRPNYWLLPMSPAEIEELQNSFEAKEAARLLSP